MRTGERVLLGVDIGGTKVAAGLVNSAGEILYSARRRMVVNRSAAEALRPVKDSIDAVFEKHKARPSAIGVSVPGWVDAQRGVLLSATNLPCWQDYPLA